MVTSSRGHTDIIHSGGGDTALSQHTVRGGGSMSPALTHRGMTQAGAMTVTVMGQVSGKRDEWWWRV